MDTKDEARTGHRDHHQAGQVEGQPEASKAGIDFRFKDFEGSVVLQPFLRMFARRPEMEYTCLNSKVTVQLSMILIFHYLRSWKICWDPKMRK